MNVRSRDLQRIVAECGTNESAERKDESRALYCPLPYVRIVVSSDGLPAPP
jgi:hypothetical protein